ncbi:Putative membrane protein [Pseudomonas [fluorescens] SBW25]|uniref:Membrane protein n=2 Tax=Pseudomonas fluorescens TaxID=294 RepID=C3JXX8_PSEFS|nr:Putative membrane protein [Pseudomonas fluorescens SBW25]
MCVMLYRLAADSLVLFHLTFILFVLFGGLLALKWRPVVWLHLPAVAWGIAVEVFHLPCPLTRWENLFRHLAGQDGYGGGFIEHYLLTLIYPAGLTPQIQLGLGALVLAINILVYGRLIRRYGQA